MILILCSQSYIPLPSEMAKPGNRFLGFYPFSKATIYTL